MELKFSRGGVLHRLNYGVVEKEVSDVAHQYLNNIVVFDEDGITIGDIYDLLAKDKVLSSIYRRNFTEEFLDYLASVPPKKRLALYQKQLKKPDGIEFVKISRVYSYDDVNQVFNLNTCGLLSLTAMSKVLNRSYNSYKKGQRINYSITGIDLAMLYHTPVKYDTVTVLSQNNHESSSPVNRREYSKEKKFIVPTITLNELIESVTWELSFYGSPAKAKETFEEISLSLKNVRDETDFTKEAGRIASAVSTLIFSEKDEVVDIIKSAYDKKITFTDAANKLLEIGQITISAGFDEEKNAVFKRLIANSLEVINRGQCSIDVEYLIAISEGDFDSRQKQVKHFNILAAQVKEKIAVDVPEDEAHAERNQIAINKIAEVEAEIKSDSFTQKNIVFINDELEDLITDINKKKVGEIFVHIDRINKNLNEGFGERRARVLLGFDNLPESLDKDKSQKLASLIEALPNNVLMKDFVEVMFQNSATLSDDFAELTAYEYRLKVKIFEKGDFFSVHDNKALEKKNAETYKRYVEKYIQENTQTEEAKRIVSEGAAIFEEDVELLIKATHKLATEIRPDVSLLRWKTITPKKPKTKKSK